MTILNYILCGLLIFSMLFFILVFVTKENVSIQKNYPTFSKTCLFLGVVSLGVSVLMLGIFNIPAMIDDVTRLNK